MQKIKDFIKLLENKGIGGTIYAIIGVIAFIMGMGYLAAAMAGIVLYINKNAVQAWIKEALATFLIFAAVGSFAQIGEPFNYDREHIDVIEVDSNTTHIVIDSFEYLILSNDTITDIVMHYKEDWVVEYYIEHVFTDSAGYNKLSGFRYYHPLSNTFQVIDTSGIRKKIIFTENVNKY